MSNREVVKQRLLENLYAEVDLGAHALLASTAGPSAQAFIGATTLRTVNPTTEDGVEFDAILPRSVEMDIATITLQPVVRWTSIDTPTADQTVLWKMDYTYAMPGLDGEDAADSTVRFVDVRTLNTTVHTLTGNEYRAHIVTAFPAFHFPARNFGPSCLVKAQIRISSVSTVANSLIGILGVGVTYVSGPSGTSSITP